MTNPFEIHRIILLLVTFAFLAPVALARADGGEWPVVIKGSASISKSNAKQSNQIDKRLARRNSRMDVYQIPKKTEFPNTLGPAHEGKIPGEVKDYLENKGFKAAMFFQRNGNFRYFDLDNLAAHKCGQISDDGEITIDECSQQVSANQFVLFNLKPGCKLGRHQGKLAVVHKNPKQVGHRFKCH